MKYLILILFTFFIINIYSQSNSIVDFVPLKIGNTWIYNNWGIPPGPNKSKLTVTGSHVFNGHLYYDLSLQFSSSFGCRPNPFSYGVLNIRIDSLTGKVVFHNAGGCNYSPDYKMIDSMLSRLNDSFYSACSFRFRCNDTISYNIFGNLRATRKFIAQVGSDSYMRRYVKNIGIYEHAHGVSGQGCSSSLLGAVIDGILYGDTSFPVGINIISSQMPAFYSLSQNYPNPFNPVTYFRFEIPELRFVKLIVYDLLGREIATLVNEQLKPGTYEVEWDGSNYASGVYFYTLTAGDPSLRSGQGFTQTKKLILLK